MAQQRLLFPSTCTAAPRRLFSATSACCKRPKDNPLGQRLLKGRTIPPPPPYPYGPAKWYKQSDTGLYGGAMIMFGNNIAPKSEVKTRRAWHPNVVHKSLYSAALCRWVRLKITVRALRTIDKVGGLDNYLLGGTAARLKELGEHGWKLRWAVMTTKKIQEQMKQDSELRRAVGYMGHVARHPEELTQPATVGEEMSETVAETTEQIKEGKQDEGEEIEQRIRQRLEEDQLMREEPAPSRSLWQRVKGMFGRS